MDEEIKIDNHIIRGRVGGCMGATNPQPNLGFFFFKIHAEIFEKNLDSHFQFCISPLPLTESPRSI
ncbi:hypothetical protein PSY31_23895, partial [Shigella flexneri]|nr:hypothetical protein [Shigella flexneri]